MSGFLVFLALLIVGAALAFLVLGGIGRLFGSSSVGCLFGIGIVLLTVASLVLLGAIPFR